MQGWLFFTWVRMQVFFTQVRMQGFFTPVRMQVGQAREQWGFGLCPLASEA